MYNTSGVTINWCFGSGESCSDIWMVLLHIFRSNVHRALGFLLVCGIKIVGQEFFCPTWFFFLTINKDIFPFFCLVSMWKTRSIWYLATEATVHCGGHTSVKGGDIQAGVTSQRGVTDRSCGWEWQAEGSKAKVSSSLNHKELHTASRNEVTKTSCPEHGKKSRLQTDIGKNAWLHLLKNTLQTPLSCHLFGSLTVKWCTSSQNRPELGNSLFELKTSELLH